MPDEFDREALAAVRDETGNFLHTNMSALATFLEIWISMMSCKDPGSNDALLTSRSFSGFQLNSMRLTSAWFFDHWTQPQNLPPLCLATTLLQAKMYRQPDAGQTEKPWIYHKLLAAQESASSFWQTLSL